MAYAVTEFSNVNGHTGPGFMLENCAVSPVTVAQSLPGFGNDHARVMAELPHLARCVVVLRDLARGSIRDGSDAPELSYRPAPEDLWTLREGLRAATEAYFAAGAEEVHLPLQGVAPLRSPRDLDRAAVSEPDPRRWSLLYAVHLFGGAIMGGSAEYSTCDETGRVWGVDGLYVSDAASLPTNTGVNPQVTIMANALRIAEGAAAEFRP
jgi:choline dehydrogenase-like flavoprotein